MNKKGGIKKSPYDQFIETRSYNKNFYIKSVLDNTLSSASFPKDTTHTWLFFSEIIIVGFINETFSIMSCLEINFSDRQN